MMYPKTVICKTAKDLELTRTTNSMPRELRNNSGQLLIIIDKLSVRWGLVSMDDRI